MTQPASPQETQEKSVPVVENQLPKIKFFKTMEKAKAPTKREEAIYCYC